MHCHLVSIEVRVVSGTYQRMQLDGFSFYQDRLKGLDSQSVQRRGTVEHNRMLLDHFFQNIPYFRLETFYHLLSVLDIVSGPVLHQLLHNERLEQLDGHLFGQTALIDLQLRSYYDNGTSGIVHTFSQKVLTEPSGFSFQHIGKRLKGTVSGACYRTASAAVVDQGVHRFLQHSLFISYDNVRRAQLQQAFQTVIPVDDPAVQVI